jgi:hypothetical protein
MVVHDHLATVCSILPATSQDLRFGIKFVLLSRIEIKYGGEPLKPFLFCTQQFHFKKVSCPAVFTNA